MSAGDAPAVPGPSCYPRPRLLALALTALLVAPPVDLGWHAPSECPDEAAARAAIDELLQGRTPPGDRRVVADVAIEPGGRGWRARVRIDDGTSVGERDLEAASCDEVGEAAALIVAMAVDPRLAGDATPDEPPADEPPIPTPPPEATDSDTEADGSRGVAIAPAPSPPVEPERERKRRALKLFLRAGGGVGFGSVSTVAGVVMLAVALGGHRWRMELDADVWTPRTSPQDDAIGVRVLGWTLGVRGCGSPLARKLEIPLCAGMRAGALHGRGAGPIESRSERSPWITATAGVGLWGWIAPRFALALDVDGFVSITQPAFDLQPSGFTVRAPAGGVRAVFGPVVRLP